MDFLDKRTIDITILAWYILFAIFFLWTAFTVVPTTAAALKSQSYSQTMQSYTESLVAIIFIFAALFALLTYLAKSAGPNDNHIFPWMTKIYPKDNNVGATVVFLLLALCIVIVSVYLRTTMLQFFGFYEPDGFYYFSVVRAALNNGFRVPSVLSISGWPSHAPYTEAKGLIVIPLVQYAVLQYIGESYYTIMRLSPVLFALLDMLGAYILSRYLSKDKLFGLLVIAFVGFSMGNAARTSALIFRGDTFVSFFLLVALILLVELFRQQTQQKKIIFAVLTGVALALGNFVWNGGTFGLGVFMFTFILLGITAFIMRKEQIVNDSVYILFSIAVWFICVVIAYASGFIIAQQFINLSFIPVFLTLAVFWVLIYYLTLSIQNVTLLQPTVNRLVAIAAVTTVGLLIFAILEPGIINNVFVANGFVSAPGSVGSTIQELQPPTAEFLYTSFGINLFTTPQTLLMYLPSYFQTQNSSTLFGALTYLGVNSSSRAFNPSITYAGINQNYIWGSNGSNLGLVAIILLFILFVPYLFMQIYDSGGFVSGSARVRLDLNIVMIVLVAYFVLTAYLQMHVIRFNALISMPLAILSAYTIYWIIIKVLNFAKDPMAKLVVGILCCVFFILFFYNLLTNDNAYAQTLSQADSINPTFLSALTWMKSSLPSNSVVLTLWPDGSVVEGVANLTSVTDSVGSQNGTKLVPFAGWILNSSPDPQFLESHVSGRPNYLLVRFPWLIETQGIYTEAEIPENASLFGYLPLTNFQEGGTNSTSRQLIFRTSPTGYPYAVVNLNQISNVSMQSTISGYIQLSSTQVSTFNAVGFYNQNNGNYTLAPQSQSSNGEDLVVIYSSVPRQNFYLNITGVYIFGPGMAQSNMIKFLYFCSASSCAWDNSQATMRMVYQNGDTKVLKITYLNASTT